MLSGNKTVLKARSLLQKRMVSLVDRRSALRENIQEKYPYELYGTKGISIYEERKKALDREIDLLVNYIMGMDELADILEGGKKR